MAERVQARFCELVGEPLRVDVCLVESLPRTAAGKHVPILSELRE